MKRRTFCTTTTALSALAFTRCTPVAPVKTQPTLVRAIAHLEPPGARLGVAALDLQTGATLTHREHERFAMCSTFKLPLAAFVLQSAEQGRLRLDEQLTFTRADLVPHAPVTEPRVDEGAMSVEELARAGQITSDNVAANLLLRRLGGPASLTQFFRELGDTYTRLDDYEPELNITPVGALPNTTTPLAMAQLVGRFASPGTLTVASQATLKRWMLETSTGAKRLRAGFPKHWEAGDKTGTSLGKGFVSRYNDVACVWFVGRAPLVVACYLESPVETEHMSDELQLVLARVGTIVTRWAHETRA